MYEMDCVNPHCNFFRISSKALDVCPDCGNRLYVQSDEHPHVPEPDDPDGEDEDVAL